MFGLSETLPCPRRYLNCNSAGIPDLQVWRHSNRFAANSLFGFVASIYWTRPIGCISLVGSTIDPYQQVQARIETMAAIIGCHHAHKNGRCRSFAGRSWQKRQLTRTAKSTTFMRSIRSLLEDL